MVVSYDNDDDANDYRVLLLMIMYSHNDRFAAPQWRLSLTIPTVLVILLAMLKKSETHQNVIF